MFKMSNSNKKTLVVFICLLLAIFALAGYNIYKKHQKYEVDRKVEKVFDFYSYAEILDKGEVLLQDGIRLLKDNLAFNYEKNNMNKLNIYAINDYNKYKKITNFNLVTNTISSSQLKDFMKLRKIINFENDYYMESYAQNYEGNLVGSTLEIQNYTDSIVTFKVVSYYCANEKYLGILESTPNCDYKKDIKTFTINNNSNLLRVNNYEELINILNYE